MDICAKFENNSLMVIPEICVHENGIARQMDGRITGNLIPSTTATASQSHKKVKTTKV